ncbi:MAG: hypothetical protein PHW53_04690 [Patescibacteria group bacterium]|nr:hypothetical protein [Patescibacteria group bacterium]
MTLVTYDISDCKVGILKSGTPEVPEQAVWGTATADAGNALELNVKVFELNEDVQQREGDAALTGTRSDDAMNHQADTKGSLPSFEVSTPNGVVKAELAPILYAHTQNVTEGATTPYQKTFTFHATQPDFTANAGSFASFVFKAPDASNSLKVKDCIGTEKLAFKLPVNGYLEAVQSWRGRGAVVSNANPSGTWARSAISRFHANDMTMQINFGAGAQTITVLGDIDWETTIETTPAGQATGDFASFHLGVRKGTFKTRINYDANAKSAEANLRNGTLCTVTMVWGSTGVDGYLAFTFYVKLKKCNRVRGEGGIFAEDIEAVIVGNVASSQAMYTVALADALDWGY